MWIFKPIFKTTIWGGDRIPAFKGVETEQINIGESWEISGVEGSESIVANGEDKGMTISQLIDKYGSDLLGERNYKKFGERFPLLIKFIDAHEDLSVQVHPNDELAHRRDLKSGKTEMWYVLEADKGARLATGFKEPVDPDSYRDLVETGEIMDVLNFNRIKPGDTFFIPAGRVHSIGKGSFVVEIQQTADITYRIYDFHRKDKDGNERELHTDLAFDAINFNDTDEKRVKYIPHPDIPVNLLTSPYFTTNLLQIDEKMMRDYSESDTFAILIAINGEAEITCGKETVKIRKGTSILIPASAKGIGIEPQGKFAAIETYIK